MYMLIYQDAKADLQVHGYLSPPMFQCPFPGHPWKLDTGQPGRFSVALARGVTTGICEAGLAA